MALLPSFPTFVNGDSSLLKLQQLSYAVNFLTNCTINPLYHAFNNGSTDSITANTWTTIPAGTVLYDNDGQGQGTSKFEMTCGTQGIYAFEGSTDWFTNGGSQFVAQSFLFTAGSSNANLTAGTTIRFGYKSMSNPSDASTDSVYCVKDICPVTMYAGDKVDLQAWCATTTSIVPINNTSYLRSRFITNVSNKWIAYAT